MKFEYLKNLRGPEGQRFADEPKDIRAPLEGEWYLHMGTAVKARHNYREPFSAAVILQQVKTVREWLEELPDGWREEALENIIGADLVRDSLSRAVGSGVNWGVTPTGLDAWDRVYKAIENGDPIPPHPSTLSSRPKGKPRGPLEACDIADCETDAEIKALKKMTEEISKRCDALTLAFQELSGFAAAIKASKQQGE
jgi:hypothetical protein